VSASDFILVSDLTDEDTIRFYNPDTKLYLDVPFSIARQHLLTIQEQKDMRDFGWAFVGIFENETSTGFIGKICYL
jgi:hypothetical protein